MEIQTESFKRCELVTVSGILNSTTSMDFEETLLRLIRAKRPIIVNMRDVESIFSSGLKALLTALMKGRKLIPACRVVISEVQPEIKESFDLVGFDRLFEFYGSDTEAIGSF